MKKNRFEILSRENLNYIDALILRDRITGVLYLQTHYIDKLGGLTPLLDKEGKPVIDLNDSKNKESE